VASFFSNFGSAQGIVGNVLMLVFGAFTIWMLVDAIRREEWLWVIFIFLFPILNAPLYFFIVYRNSASFATRGFQLPGTFQRSRIKSLEAQIHHLDKAHHHLELGDIYFQQGKLQQALDCYLRAQGGACRSRYPCPSWPMPVAAQPARRSPAHAETVRGKSEA
jgi:hypothetical protein